MTEPAITPELVETAARALAHPTPWDEIPPGARDVLLSDARDAITAVAPLIDRAGRVDELRKQAKRLRHLGRQAHASLDRELAEDPGGHLVERWDAVANERHGTAQVLEAYAEEFLSVPTEENPRG